ncbi:type VI secretion system membrane subunit TssM [Alkalimarinus sediminis]|uniref:Type VI secretion system membrane subunit TssM n=1 Tax=Alkalimarinus sediminis TaxID=1632866 RepID=A0A9E8KQV3_9ALTE|nr:type VI secretion system membrane subunit TssM [Alkalimarinus sediminis]UZW75605.1 type VI secretion system membrane subunit TssM [Alkalimarinus sediminis]
MKWKAIRFFSKNREERSSNDLPEMTLSTKAYQSLFKQQIKALSETFGEQKIACLFKQPLHKKTVYCVLESPHANLTALSGHALADVTPRVKGQVTPSQDGLNSSSFPYSRYTLPSWHSDGSSLYMSLHFENEVYTSNYSFEDTLLPLMDTLLPPMDSLRGRHRNQCLGGIIIYLHRHDLISESAPAWLSKMASFVGQASLKAKQKLPVYIVLEGVGSSETITFDNASSNSLTMPIGMFRDDETVSAEQFGQWFSQAQGELTKRLMRKTLKRVQYVHDVESRKAAFSHLNAIEQGLQQLKQVSEQLNHRWSFSGKPIVPWVRAVFIAPNNTAVISGVSGVSGTHALSRQGDTGCYQWWQRFSNILHKDKGCGKAEPDNNNHRKLVASCAGGVVLLGLVWSQLMWRDYAQAGQLVDQFNEQLMPLSSANGNGAELSAGFDRILEKLIAIDAYNVNLDEEKQSADWLSSFLDSTIDKQQQTLRLISDSVLMNDFNAALDQLLLETLHRHDDFEALYPALKSYLYFHQDRAQRSEYLMWWFGQQWQQTYQHQPDKRQMLAGYLSAFLESQTIVEAVDEEAVAIARAKMLSTPLAKRMYFDIKQSANNRYSASSELKEIIGYRQMDVFDAASVSVPTFYTKLGYQTQFLPKMRQAVEQVSADEWVLGEAKQGRQAANTSDSASLENSIYDLYIAEYTAAWDDFLDQLAIAKSTSFDHLISLVKGSSGSDGAVSRVLNYVHDNTNFYSIPTAASAAGVIEGAAGVVPSSLAASANKASRGLKGVDHYLNEKGGDTLHPMSAVTKHYKRLNSVINNSENKSSAMEEINKQLVMLEEYLSELDSSNHDLSNMSAVFDATVKRVKGSRKDAISQLNRTSRLMPEPLNRWVSSLSGQSWGHMVSRTKRFIDDAYQNEIVEFYSAHLNKKYPLSPQAEDDVLVDRFSEFFKPEGREQNFFNQYLQPFIRTSNKRWTEKSVDGLSLGFKRDYLAQLKRANTIRKILFNSNQEAFAELQLQPVYLDANISRFDLNLMGARLSYRHGPQKVSKISWPPLLNEDDIAMRFEDYNGNLVTEEMSGEWSLFRLIERYGKESSPNGQRFRMSFEVEGQRAVYNASGRTLTPALLSMLSKYRAPLKPLG